MNIDLTKEYLSIEKAAEYLGVGVSTIYRWKKQGKLEYVKGVGKIRIEKSYLDNIKKFYLGE